MVPLAAWPLVMKSWAADGSSHLCNMSLAGEDVSHPSTDVETGVGETRWRMSGGRRGSWGETEDPQSGCDAGTRRKWGLGGVEDDL